MNQTELTRAQKLTLIYRHTHKDYKGNHPELGKSILVLRGGTTLVALKDLTDAEIAERLDYSLKLEEKRLAKLAAKKAPAAPVEEEDAPTYEVVRFFKDINKESEVIEGGLTRDEAKERVAEHETTPESFVGFRQE